MKTIALQFVEETSSGSHLLMEMMMSLHLAEKYRYTAEEIRLSGAKNVSMLLASDEVDSEGMQEFCAIESDAIHRSDARIRVVDLVDNF